MCRLRQVRQPVHLLQASRPAAASASSGQTASPSPPCLSSSSSFVRSDSQSISSVPLIQQQLQLRQVRQPVHLLRASNPAAASDSSGLTVSPSPPCLSSSSSFSFVRSDSQSISSVPLVQQQLQLRQVRQPVHLLRASHPAAASSGQTASPSPPCLSSSSSFSFISSSFVRSDSQSISSVPLIQQQLRQLQLQLRQVRQPVHLLRASHPAAASASSGQTASPSPPCLSSSSSFSFVSSSFSFVRSDSQSISSVPLIQQQLQLRQVRQPVHLLRASHPAAASASSGQTASPSPPCLSSSFSFVSSSFSFVRSDSQSRQPVHLLRASRPASASSGQTASPSPPCLSSSCSFVSSSSSFVRSDSQSISSVPLMQQQLQLRQVRQPVHLLRASHPTAASASSGQTASPSPPCLSSSFSFVRSDSQSISSVPLIQQQLQLHQVRQPVHLLRASHPAAASSGQTASPSPPCLSSSSSFSFIRSDSQSISSVPLIQQQLHQVRPSPLCLSSSCSFVRSDSQSISSVPLVQLQLRQVRQPVHLLRASNPAPASSGQTASPSPPCLSSSSSFSFVRSDSQSISSVPLIQQQLQLRQVRQPVHLLRASHPAAASSGQTVSPSPLCLLSSCSSSFVRSDSQSISSVPLIQQQLQLRQVRQPVHLLRASHPAAASASSGQTASPSPPCLSSSSSFSFVRSDSQSISSVPLIQQQLHQVRQSVHLLCASCPAAAPASSGQTASPSPPCLSSSSSFSFVRSDSQSISSVPLIQQQLQLRQVRQPVHLLRASHPAAASASSGQTASPSPPCLSSSFSFVSSSSSFVRSDSQSISSVPLIQQQLQLRQVRQPVQTASPSPPCLSSSFSFVSFVRSDSQSISSVPLIQLQLRQVR
ncbi:uncharacterized protein LOC127907458 [Oncorhynchus keta]|uniref:uncharacterized protein LOC127907458 n=1 Tax=Oncorhynchus keta TaxID=8018 RepID=UPI00227B9E51|nr:uncharacterized protein LOC127907458 [Oncorhynchus keta]